MLEYILKIEFLLNLSKQIQGHRSKQVQNWVEEGRGAEGSYINLLQLLCSYGIYLSVWCHVLKPHYVEFVYENDILMRNRPEFIYAKVVKKKSS